MVKRGGSLKNTGGRLPNCYRRFYNAPFFPFAGDAVDTQLEQRLEDLEAAHDALRMHNRMLTAALQGLFRALPADWAEDAAESVQQAFEDELAQLDYENSPHADAFQDAVATFWRSSR